MSRIERLVNLTAALLAAERPLSADELRSRVPGYPDEKASFRRQFERDKEVLRELGLPLSTETIAGDATETQIGYRIVADDYYLRDPGLAPDELSALHLASRVVQIDGLGDGVWKLGEAVTPAHPVEAIAATLPVVDALPALFAAIAAGTAVVFAYRDASRLIQPSRLSFQNGHWYVAGYDADRNDDRSFRVDRIVGPVEVRPALAVPVVSESASEPPRRRAGAFSRPWELGEGQGTVANVRIDAAQAAWAVSHLGTDALVAEHTGGDVTVALLVRSPDAFRSFVLGFLDHAVVESPDSMRALVVDWLSALREAG